MLMQRNLDARARIAPTPTTTRRLLTPVRAYMPPSSQTSANELAHITRYSILVPDSLLGVTTASKPKAATVSFAALSGIVAAESLGLRPYQVKIRDKVVGPTTNE